MQQLEIGSIIENNAKPELPRINRQFIGLSHELQQQKKKCRRIEKQQGSLINKILHAEKLQTQNKKSLSKKRQYYKSLMKIINRQRQQNAEKQKRSKQKEKNLDLLRQQNRSQHRQHQQNKQKKQSLLFKQNHKNYIQGKAKLQMYERKKKQNNEWTIMEKRTQVLNMSLEKQKSRDKIDKFYKNKNKKHTQNYKNLIANQNNKFKIRLDTIKKLGPIQAALRQQLNNSTMQINRLNDMILKASRTVDMNSSSRISLNSSSKINSRFMNEQERNDCLKESQSQQRQQIQEKIDPTQTDSQKQIELVHVRRKNKHKNKFKRYQAF